MNLSPLFPTPSGGRVKTVQDPGGAVPRIKPLAFATIQRNNQTIVCIYK